MSSDVLYIYALDIKSYEGNNKCTKGIRHSRSRFSHKECKHFLSLLSVLIGSDKE